jgi:micrococcal nuclease
VNVIKPREGIFRPHEAVLLALGLWLGGLMGLWLGVNLQSLVELGSVEAIEKCDTPKPTEVLPMPVTVSAPSIDYRYNAASIRRVVDGDTVDVVVDLGFRVTSAQRLRLIGIDTPEPNSKEAEERVAAHKATAYVRKCLERKGTQVRIHSIKEDSFGRWLAEIYFRAPEGGKWRHLNGELLKEGLAVSYRR